METMPRSTIWTLLAALAGTTVFCAPSTAYALGPIDLEIGLKAGYGTTPSNTPDGAPNPLGAGIGGRVGVSFLGLYGGLQAIYYFGGSGPTIPLVGGSLSEHSVLYGIEAGYGVKLLEALTLRGQVGVGNATFTSSIGSNSQDTSNVYIEPGIVGIFSLPFGGWFLGADANILVLPGLKDSMGKSQTDASFTLHGQLGYKF
jgi:hypothetical protein